MTAAEEPRGYFAHETAVVDPPCEIGDGTKIWHFSHVMRDSRIGARCNIGQNVVVSPQCVIGDNVKIQNNVSVYTGVIIEDDVFCGPSMVFTNVINPRSFIERKDEYRRTLIRRGASIGANATIVCGVTLGRYCVVGAGAVVTRDVPEVRQSCMAIPHASGAGYATAASASTSAATTRRSAEPGARPAAATTGERDAMSPKAESASCKPVVLMQVVGARPQFVKLAPLCRAIEAANAGGAAITSLSCIPVSTTTRRCRDVFFSELGIPKADLDLGVGSGSHGRQTARMLEALETAMLERRPDMVLTYGDTNSTLAATLAAVKLHLPVAHIEAGLRSFNRRMPEEANRLAADHLSDLLFAPTPD